MTPKADYRPQPRRCDANASHHLMERSKCFVMLVAVASLSCLTGAVFAQGEDPEIDGKVVSQWVRQLRSENRGLQVRASQALAAAPTNLHARIAPLVEPILKSEREDDRFVAAQVLGDYGPLARTAVPDLVPLLKGTQFERNRAAAAKALGQLLKDAQPSEEVDRVTDALVDKITDDYDKYPDVRREAAKALGMIGPAAKKCIPKLDKVLMEYGVGVPDNDYRAIRGATAWTLGRMGPLAVEYVDRLISLMHRDMWRSPEYVEALGCIGPVRDNVVHNIMDVIEPPSDAMRGVMEAYVALEEFGPKSAPAVPLLCRLLKGPGISPAMRIQIVKVLKAVGPAAAEAEPLLPTLCAGKTPDDYYGTNMRGITQEEIAELKKACAGALDAFKAK